MSPSFTWSRGICCEIKFGALTITSKKGTFLLRPLALGSFPRLINWKIIFWGGLVFCDMFCPEVTTYITVHKKPKRYHRILHFTTQFFSHEL